MKRILGFIAALGLYGILFYFVFTNSLEKEVNFEVYIQYRKVIFNGWVTTLGISAVSLGLALLVGLLLYLMRESKFKVLYYLSEIGRAHV